MSGLDGASALLVGGASGMGAATALLLAERGARLVVADLDEERGQAVAAKVGGRFIRADLTSETDVIAATEAAGELGPLRALVVTAALGAGALVVGTDGSPTSAHPMALFDKVVQVDLAGTFNCVRIAASAMSRLDPVSEDGDRGAIVLTASRAGLRGDVGQSAYSAAKSGLFGLTRTLARELAHHGIRVNLIAPGGFDTPILANVPAAEKITAHEIAATSFPRRLGRPEEYATLAWELLTNGYINGAHVPIDGGAAR
jgi:NAD(P)-dependent dehydrogenase (short-subunit alcohol dehydrogenase family)